MRAKSRTEYSILNILAGVGGYALSVILSLVNRMVFTRCFSQAYLGISGLFSNILSMLSLAELGISGAIIYALYKPIAIDDREKIAALVQLFGKAYYIIGTVIAAGGLALLPFLKLIIGNQPDIHESIYLIYVIYLFNTASSYFFSYRSTLLVAAQKNYLVTGLNYIILCIQSVIQAAFILVTHNYIGYLLIQAAFTLIYNIWISHVAVKHYPYIKEKHVNGLKKEERRALFKNVKDLMYYKVSGVLVNGTDNIIITFFSGLSVTGMASNYTLLINTLNTLLAQVFNGLTASIGNHNVLSEEKSKYEMFTFLNMIKCWIYGWVSLGLYFCCTDLIAVLFGHKYILPDVISLILALNFYVSGVTNVVGTYKDTMGLFHYGRFIQIFTAIINIVLSISLGKICGLAGILLATVIARSCTHLWYTPYVVYKYGFKKKPIEYLWMYIRYLIIGGIAFIICNSVFYYVTGNPFKTLVLKIILCTLVSNCVYIAFLYKTKEFKRLKSYIKVLWEKIQKKK